jgi:L-aminopeptidase/D-esterase-like protein
VITDVPGVRVGHWTGEGTGVTVVLLPDGSIAAAEVRGGAPAEREVVLLDPARTVERVDAVVLTGGSAFGLATADGVVRRLAEQGRGVRTAGGVVPIVPTAAIYDLVESGGRPPGPAEGLAALEAAEGDAGARCATGRIGAGRGARVGTWRGTDHGAPGGLGSAAAACGDAHVGAIAVVNAVGDVVGADGQVLAGSSAPPDAVPFPERLVDGEHTTLVCVVTDARCTKADCFLLAQSAHHGLARAIHPSHTRFDGDLAVAAATGIVDAPLDRLRIVVTDVVAEAVRAAVTAD